jgi:hypothetical protein
MKIKTLLLWQSLILVGGTVFAWSKLLGQFDNFKMVYGTVFRFKDCVISNPFLTPCFWGSMAFIFATVWAFSNWLKPGYTRQRYLRNFLLFCVFFAGSVVAYEFIEYYKLLGANTVSISCAPGVFPLLTPCFTGLLFFLCAYSWSVGVTRKLRN